MKASKKRLSINMYATSILLCILIIAIILAIFGVPSSAQTIALTIVIPIIILAFIFLYYCSKRVKWAYLGASILGALGICLRLIISTQPNLEPAGGVPIAIAAVYILIGALLCLEGARSFLELKHY